ncbi:hypothetical protein [Catellatospora paridis]|uniref:hypothetical protein n=1 Tax=Catellatospora paridis TaxID=1617086 RepID=UPI0018AFEB95|nr:hypothetical protein [Catellatospora paridis]
MRISPARLQAALDTVAAEWAVGALAEARDDTGSYALSSGVSAWGTDIPSTRPATSGSAASPRRSRPLPYFS